MIQLDAHKSVHFCDGLKRRDFLQAGALSLLGLTLSDVFALRAAAQQPGSSQKPPDKNCILLFLVGAPSQLDTWDMKPDAPSEVRGPYKPIATNVPGISISEIFPRMATHADKFALLRSVPLGRRRARRRASGDADRPPVPGRHRNASRRLRRQLPARPEG